MKSKLASLLTALRSDGWEPGLTPDSYERIIDIGFRGKNLALAAVVAEIASHEKPITLRGLFYRVVSAGWLPSTDQKHYNRLGRILTKLRESEAVPFAWIVDNLRSSMKPSSWTGLEDFAETCANAYRLDFWSSLPTLPHIFVEKDAIAGVVQPITRKFDVALSPCRGYASLSFAHEIAETWTASGKPVFAFYLGDYDPSGFDIERDLQDKLRRYHGGELTWKRLGVNEVDFDDFDLLPLKPKNSDRRYAAFVRDHGHQCAEVDAIPATVLRERVESAIRGHIPAEEWERLQLIEKLERETFRRTIGALTA